MLTVLRWPVGGIRTYILYNYPALLAQGYRFTFVGPAESSFRALAEELRAWDGTEVVEAPLRGRKCRLGPTIRCQLSSGRFEIVHSHGMIAAAHAAWANRRLAVPHVITAHDVFRPTQVEGPLGRAKLWLLGQLLRRADVLVAVGEDARANIQKYLPMLAKGPCRLVSILNGIDTDRSLIPSPSEIRNLKWELGLGAEEFLIGFLGRFMEQKGFLPLLEALGELALGSTRVPFHLVAVGSGDYEREYRLEVERRGLSRKVSFLEFVPDVSPILGQLDLLVMPSLWEACSLLPMEAMVLGIPVLGTDCIGLREVLRGTPSVMVPAGDSRSLCQALRSAIAAPWTEAARAYAPEARRRFDVAEAAERLGQIFDQVLRASRSLVRAA